MACEIITVKVIIIVTSFILSFQFGRVESCPAVQRNQKLVPTDLGSVHVKDATWTITTCPSLTMSDSHFLTPDI